jgi:hypothetical protein
MRHGCRHFRDSLADTFPDTQGDPFAHVLADAWTRHFLRDAGRPADTFTDPLPTLVLARVLTHFFDAMARWADMSADSVLAQLDKTTADTGS